MSAYYLIPDPGCIRISGDDHRSFIQRQTTNHIDLLAPQRSLLTVLTSPTARILDVLVLFEDGSDILALTLPGQGEATARYLRSRVFFMDKVNLAGESASYVQLDLFGLQPHALDALGFPAAVEGSAVASGHSGARLIHLHPSFGPGFRLFAPASLLPELEARMAEAGAAALTAQDYALRRIEAGLPSPSEWNEEYTPLETGLRAAVSDSKGCYTGQEIIARQITYDKVTRRLCGLRLDQPVPAPAGLFSPDGAPAGRITSAALSPRFGPIALAVVKRPYDDAGTVLQAGDPAGGCRAEVSVLPFA